MTQALLRRIDLLSCRDVDLSLRGVKRRGNLGFGTVTAHNCHCEERSDVAISEALGDCFAWLAMTIFRRQELIPLRVQRSDMPLVRRAPACAPRERADTQVCPSVAATLPLEVDFVSSLRKRIGMKHYPNPARLLTLLSLCARLRPKPC